MTVKHSIAPWILVAAAAVSTGCAGDRARDYSGDNRCRNCSGGGLSSGPDGVFTIDSSSPGAATEPGAPAAASGHPRPRSAR